MEKNSCNRRVIRDEYDLAHAYLRAKQYLLATEYAWEAVPGPGVDPNLVTESTFLREAAWVILSAGMSEKVVRGKFPMVSASFLHWVSGERIARHGSYCAVNALSYFGHVAKISSILDLCSFFSQHDFEEWKRDAFVEPIEAFRGFRFIGPITSFHLAKNLGFQCAKPDRHLVRFCEASGFEDVAAFCGAISKLVGDDLRTVDSVLWRFATLVPNYLELFKKSS
jgi:hypothetical protein